MRLGVTAALFTATLFTTTTALAKPPADLSGSWSVVSEPIWSTCDGGAEKGTYQWVLNHSGDTIKVTASGETAFPKFQGSFDGEALTIEGQAKKALGTGLAGVYPSAVFRLELTRDGRLEGTRFYLGESKRKGGGTRLCTIAFSVEGKRL